MNTSLSLASDELQAAIHELQTLVHHAAENGVDQALHTQITSARTKLGNALRSQFNDPLAVDSVEMDGERVNIDALCANATRISDLYVKNTTETPRPFVMRRRMMTGDDGQRFIHPKDLH